MDREDEIPLEQAEFFRRLPAGRLAELRAVLCERSFERRQVLYFEGHPCDRLWVVRRGQVRLYKSSPGGQITTLDLLGPGEIFGAVSAMEEESYPSGAEAVTAGSAWWIPRASFESSLEAEPRLAAEILAIVSRRLREAQDRVRALSHDPAPARLAAALLRVSEGGEARVTRQALAEAAGTTVETAIRVLRKLERQGLLRGEVGCIHVLDAAALRKLAGL